MRQSEQELGSSLGGNRVLNREQLCWVRRRAPVRSVRRFGLVVPVWSTAASVKFVAGSVDKPNILVIAKVPREPTSSELHLARLLVNRLKLDALPFCRCSAGDLGDSHLAHYHVDLRAVRELEQDAASSDPKLQFDEQLQPLAHAVQHK